MRKTTLLDIAKAVNVSKTTVSMVLNNKENNISKETKEKIFKAAKELNYVPNYLAKSLITKRSYSIGVIVPDIQNPFFSEMAKGIEKIAEENGYSIILCNTLNSKRRENEHIKLLMSKAIDGLIIAPSDDKSESFDILENQGIPFVIVDRVVEDFEKFNGVFCNNEKGIRLGLDYLHNKGKRNIAFIGGNKEYSTANIRLKTYIEKVIELGIYNKDFNIEDDFSLEGGFKATKRLIEKDLEIDAIFYSSDVMAIGGIKYLLRNGYKIPEDISILGFDNIDICNFIEPELTTVAQPIYNMGEEGIKLLLRLIDKKDIEEKIIELDPYLIERGTVK
ncbi:LacI family transcriptional regulator [Clostridium sardiniense]|uniref:LacI family transcriptional regulator n=1 Tax=Clostridium sardiniense TaxID=29369 RepID=A0ABS7KWL7_CLOSR|nr:LacI family DNA-binding transcriptional regulator [Clostridium sardiniense]MBM7834187.1 LacI family transcriptional regulator [Clostridium sardiniense]MBY0754967.1 LacI family transcriptional regulator [Clostridium sardiniense]MDQ0459179.1 LacI family transcriptional regulator [Clostridium sardiniense]